MSGGKWKKGKSRKVHKARFWQDCWWTPSFSPKLLPIGSILHFEKSSFPYTQYFHITSQKGHLLFISWPSFLRPSFTYTSYSTIWLFFQTSISNPQTFTQNFQQLPKVSWLLPEPNIQSTLSYLLFELYSIIYNGLSRAYWFLNHRSYMLYFFNITG